MDDFHWTIAFGDRDDGNDVFWMRCEMRLIDADELKHRMETVEMFGLKGLMKVAKEMVVVSPTVDPIKHGYWRLNGNRYCECSVCHAEGNMSANDYYCRNCGAKMDGVET